VAGQPWWALASSSLTFWYHAQTPPHSVGLLWMSDRPVSQASSWQHTQLQQERDIHSPAGIRTRRPRKRASTDPLLRPRSCRTSRFRFLKIVKTSCGPIYSSVLKDIILSCGCDCPPQMIEHCYINCDPHILTATCISSVCTTCVLSVSVDPTSWIL